MIPMRTPMLVLLAATGACVGASRGGGGSELSSRGRVPEEAAALNDSSRQASTAAVDTIPPVRSDPPAPLIPGTLRSKPAPPTGPMGLDSVFHEIAGRVPGFAGFYADTDGTIVLLLVDPRSPMPTWHPPLPGWGSASPGIASASALARAEGWPPSGRLWSGCGSPTMP